jgi:hypothetical protein
VTALKVRNLTIASMVILICGLLYYIFNSSTAFHQNIRKNEQKALVNIDETTSVKNGEIASANNNLNNLEKPFINKSETAIGNVKENPNLAIPFRIKQYTFSHSDFSTTSIAPHYVTKSKIFFSINDGNKQVSHIGSFDREANSYLRVYSTPNIINSLVGIGDHLYWVEYGRERQVNTEWKIYTFDTAKNRAELIKEGVSKDQTNPPVLKVKDDKLTWIEYEFINKEVLSKIMVLNRADNKISNLAVAKLQETEDFREGVFFSDHQPCDNGVLIHQSKFTNAKNAKKTYQIVYYQYKKPNPLYLIDGAGILDYTLKGDWLVWTEEGSVNVASLKTGKILFSFSGKSNKLTNDSPIIKNDYLLYRYSVNQIFLVNLTTGEKKELTKERIMTSKLFDSGHFLSFGYSKKSTGNSSAEFIVLEEISN